MPAPYGEDVPLAEAVGLDVVRLHPGGTARINPLDPGPGGALDGPEELARRQATMVGALLASVLHRDLTPEEDGALGWAVTQLATAAHAQPTPADLAGLLADPGPAIAGRVRVSASELASKPRPPVFAARKSAG